MLREIRVYGQLAKFLGRRTFKAAVENDAEALRFLLANFPQLEKHMADQHYKVSVGDYALTLDELHHPSGQQVISIVPVIGGAGGPTGQILAGIGLVAFSLLLPGVGAAIGGATMTKIGLIGGALILGGTAQLLTPAPSLTPVGQTPTFSGGTTASTAGTELDPQAVSYSFSGTQNTSRQGVPIPLVYGEMVVGSIVISAGVDTVQVSV